MALAFCTTCNRKQYHFLKKSCTGHSEWPNGKINVAGVMNMKVEPFKHVPKPVIVSQKINLSQKERARIAVRLAALETGVEVDIDMGPPSITSAALEGLRCTFCGVDVPHDRATLGKSAPQVRVKEETQFLTNPPKPGVTPVTTKEVYWLSKRIVACPKCCLHIKPTVDKYGCITHQGITFPETDG